MNHVNLDNRPGYFLSRSGQWMRDRRVNADRRDVPVPLHIRGMRTFVRRASDREMLEYLHSCGNDNLSRIEYAR